MNRPRDTIEEFESVTAGRFYGRGQKATLQRWIARANLLSPEEEHDVADILCSPEMEECDDLIESENLLLMLSAVGAGKAWKQALKRRIETLEQLEKTKLWKDKNDWLKFLNTKACDFGGNCERAFYLLSKGETEEAEKIAAAYAERCHVLCVKLCAALAREKGDLRAEAVYLLLLKRIEEGLYDDRLDRVFEARLKELAPQITPDVLSEADKKRIVYFDENATSIGF